MAKLGRKAEKTTKNGHGLKVFTSLYLSHRVLIK